MAARAGRGSERLPAHTGTSHGTLLWWHRERASIRVRSTYMQPNLSPPRPDWIGVARLRVHDAVARRGRIRGACMALNADPGHAWEAGVGSNQATGSLSRPGDPGGGALGNGHRRRWRCKPVSSGHCAARVRSIYARRWAGTSRQGYCAPGSVAAPVGGPRRAAARLFDARA